jgi:hypothetical protein
VTSASVVALIGRIRVGLAFFYVVASLTISLLSLAGIAYCVLTERWLPAIVILLARKDLVRWMDGEANRLGGGWLNAQLKLSVLEE